MSEEKKYNWEQVAKIRSQAHMAVRCCENAGLLLEAIEVLKAEAKEKKIARKKNSSLSSRDN